MNTNNKETGIYFNISKAKVTTIKKLDSRFESYIKNVLNYIYNCNQAVPKRNTVSAEDIFNIIVSREFNYQSKMKIMHKKDSALRYIQKCVDSDEPIKMYYAVGGGYKAAISFENLNELNYLLGLGEVLILYQVSRLEECIKELYPKGILFHIIIDNGVANYVNNIPIQKTEQYADLFSELIQKLRRVNVVKVIVQTRDFNWFESLKNLEIKEVNRLSELEYNNILRFIGRTCSMEEACLLQANYNAAMDLSGKLIADYIGDSLWFLQYSPGVQLTFRSFPGGASRIQAGDIALRYDKEKVKPFLISTNNYTDYNLENYRCNIDYFLDSYLLEFRTSKNEKEEAKKDIKRA